MNLDDVLKYGHQTVMNSINGLDEADCLVSGVCGFWSVKDIIAHLASHELVLSDILNAFLGKTSTPDLDNYLAQGYTFNDMEVDKRKGVTYAEIVREYDHAQGLVRELAARVPLEKRREVGTLPWYGTEYDLEDLVAYSNYGHKREHCAQIAVYRDTLK
jgi:hypothetical protein